MYKSLPKVNKSTYLLSKINNLVLMDNMDKNRMFFKLVWGIALIVTGTVMFSTIPYKMQQINELEPYSRGMGFFLRFSFYLISVILAGSGLKIIFQNIKRSEENK